LTVRVLIADDHPLVRQGLKAALAPLPEVEVVAEAATGQAAIREACSTGLMWSSWTCRCRS
jgi:DNA-binding NarL/FixJ family response regulator